MAMYDEIDPTNVENMERIVGMLIHDPDRGKEVLSALTDEFKKRDKNAMEKE